MFKNFHNLIIYIFDIRQWKFYCKWTMYNFIDIVYISWSIWIYFSVYSVIESVNLLIIIYLEMLNLWIFLSVMLCDDKHSYIAYYWLNYLVYFIVIDISILIMNIEWITILNIFHYIHYIMHGSVECRVKITSEIFPICDQKSVIFISS